MKSNFLWSEPRQCEKGGEGGKDLATLKNKGWQDDEGTFSAAWIQAQVCHRQEKLETGAAQKRRRRETKLETDLCSKGHNFQTASTPTSVLFEQKMYKKSDKGYVCTQTGRQGWKEKRGDAKQDQKLVSTWALITRPLFPKNPPFSSKSCWSLWSARRGFFPLCLLLPSNHVRVREGRMTLIRVWLQPLSGWISRSKHLF